jgi:hypothetical protein
MVNRGDALGLDTWRSLPMEEQMGFRIPISIMLDLPRLRAHYPVITVSEYLRLHGQTSEIESTDGFWRRESYHTHANVFESNQTKTPSLFVIENHWYEPKGTTRVDYIPDEMKRRWDLTREEGPTETSNRLRWVGVDWERAKASLSGVMPEVDLDDDAVFEGILNANGWEVLYTFAHLCVSSFLCYVTSKLILTPLLSIVELKWTRQSLPPSNKSHLARRYEDSRTTIMMWMPMLS